MFVSIVPKPLAIDPATNAPVPVTFENVPVVKSAFVTKPVESTPLALVCTTPMVFRLPKVIVPDEVIPVAPVMVPVLVMPPLLALIPPDIVAPPALTASAVLLVIPFWKV